MIAAWIPRNIEARTNPENWQGAAWIPRPGEVRENRKKTPGKTEIMF